MAGARWLWLVLAVTPVLSGCAEEDRGDLGIPESALAWAGDTVAVIGALEGPLHETFGRLWRADAPGADDLILFDIQSGGIYRYALDGAFRDALLSRGEGPGELGRAFDFHVSGNDSLWVLDPANGRISHFTLEVGGRITFRDAIPHRSGLGTICVLGSRLYHATVSAGQILHQIDRDGERVLSTGPLPEMPELDALSPGRRSVAEMNVFEGHVHCDERESLVVVAFGAHPRVQAFAADGARRWVTDLAGVHPLRYAEGGAEIAEDGVHFLRSMVPWGEATLLLQYEVRRPGDPPEGREFHGLDSRLIDIRDGTQLAQSMELPWIGARNGDRIVLLENVPYPRALVIDVD